MKVYLTILFLMSVYIANAQAIRVIDLRSEWKFTIGGDEKYLDPKYDDSKWETIGVPSPWEDEGFANYNGYACYRYSFDGSELKDMENLVLNLGYIDDVHEAYLNGELLGFKGSFPPDYYTAFNALNEYAIPNSLINTKGENVIAVKVYDLTKDGGIVKGDDIGIWANPSIQNFMNLEGVWKFTTEYIQDWQEPGINDQEWDNILVPSFWRSKHIKWGRQIKSNAWYRKEFYLPKELKGKDLKVFLGKIDDFDFAYLNGKRIGSTKDNLPFGESNSYSELRIYEINKNEINQNGLNVIAIKVEDIGGDAGIYEGPIGISLQID